MAWKLLFIVGLLFYSNTLHSQDSLGIKYYEKGQKYLYTNYDSSTLYFKKGIKYLEKTRFQEEYIDCYNGLFTVNYYRGDFNQAGDFLMKGYNKSKILDDSSEVLSTLYTCMGVYYGIKGMNKQAIKFYDKSLKYSESEIEKVPDILNKSKALTTLNDFKFAEESLKNVLDILDKEDNQNFIYRYAVYSMLAKNYFQSGNNEKAIFFFLKCKEIIETEDSKRMNLDLKIELLNYLSKSYLKNNNITSANKEINIALQIHTNPNIQFKNMTYNTLGKINEYIKNNSAAKTAYNTAIVEVLKQQHEFKYYDVIAWEYTDLAALEFKMNELDSALHTIHTAVSYFAKDVDRNQPLTTPKIEDFVYRGKVLRTLTLKAQILQALNQKSNDQKELQAAYDTYQLAAELAKLIRQDIMTQGSKQKLAGEVLPIYEGGIETALALYELTKDKQYKNTAFQFAESNKAILLLESMNDNDAKNYSGIPDSLLEKDNQLKIEITFYEKNINQERSKKEGIDEEKIKNWESSLFDLNTEYQALIELLEEQYPKYYELKYATKLTTPQDLQSQLLSSSDALIEYFVGEQNIYAFVISKDDFTITTIKKPESFQEDIDLFLYHTKRPGKTDTDFHLSLEAQHDYYVKYVQHAIQSLPTSIKRLIIIPDDVFNYIPFELFITSDLPEEDTRFSPKEHDYLFEQYIMTYNYSATLLQKSYEQKKKGKAENMLLAMAPNFNKNVIASNQPQQRACTIFDIYDLACSDKEVQEISEMMGGDYFIGQDADKATFEEIAKDYRILHLATHSCPDEEDPNFSKIFLADEAITNYDLFNYEFNADLAVLSACNTGFGKLVKGEGVMPLSKGFIQAGIPSTVMSLWPVDDCGTSRMMKLLYQYLDEGLPKDEALQKAKLDFIQNSNAIYQHPYYWSAFIHMGNFEPIHEKSSIPPVVWWIAGGLAILGLFSVSRKRKKQAA